MIFQDDQQPSGDDVSPTGDDESPSTAPSPAPSEEGQGDATPSGDDSGSAQ